MKALVTGATGFLGSRLAEALAAQGQAVRALVRPPKIPELPSDVEAVFGDLKDRESLRQAVAGIDVVYHAAAAMRGTWREFAEATIRGTEWMLEASLAGGVKRFVQISSIVVYDLHGGAGKTVIDESCPWEPAPERVGPYVHAKIEAEKNAFAFHRRGLSVAVVRPGIIYGPGRPVMHPNVGYFLTDRWLVRIGRGEGRLPVTYIDNVVDGILLAADSEKAAGQAYNLVDGSGVTRREYLDRYRKAAGSPFRVIPLPLPILLAALRAAAPLKRLGVLKHFATAYGVSGQYREVTIDAGKARRELGWRPRIGLEEGLSRTFPPRDVTSRRSADAAPRSTGPGCR